MTRRVAAWLPAVGTALLLAALPGPARGAESFRSATVCAQCHPEIYRTWRSSRHASAWTNTLFQSALERIRVRNPDSPPPCFHCHNPLRFFLEPDDPKVSIFAREGVTCEFCHSVEFLLQGIEGAGFPRYLVNPEFKFGPYPNDDSRRKAHSTKFSPLHIRSVFCAGCHEYRNRFGVSVLSTYSEWEESYYRGKSVHCQFCHLPDLFDARFMEPGKKQGPVGHGMLGGFSRDLLARALPIRATLTQEGSEARLSIQVKNDFVGHKAPSGFPIHRLRLETTLYDTDRHVLGRGEEIFERILGDGDGNPLHTPEQFFLAARQVLKDNRIAPKEVRRIDQHFPLAGRTPGKAEVALFYEISLADQVPGLASSSVSILRIDVPLSAGIPPNILALIGLGCVVLILAATIVYRRYLLRSRSAP
ncbi:MAG: multiheme c-type cytochrome [Deltaproteobacteria bacterium]